MRASVLLSTLAMALVAHATHSLTGNRALVLLDTLDDAVNYMELWNDLQGNAHAPWQLHAVDIRTRPS